MNYSTLLRRSVDFDLYAHGNIEGADTPSASTTPTRTSSSGPALSPSPAAVGPRRGGNYAHHITSDRCPNTPAHNVLMHVAFGDHQVANVTAEVEARTIGASVRWPALARAPHGREPLLRDSAPRHVPVRRLGDGAVGHGHPGPAHHEHAAARGKDPHGAPRASPLARRQSCASTAA